MSGEVPEGWHSGTIADLVSEVSVRIDPQALADPDTPYIGLEDIGQGTGRLLSIGRAGDANSQKSGFAAGDILFGKLRPKLKKVVRPDFGGICSTDIVVFRAKSDADPNFVFRVLSSDLVIEHAVAHSAGTKMPRAHARSVLGFVTMFPPLDEQRRIAEVLRSIDDQTALTAETLLATGAAKNAALTAALHNPAWPRVSVGDLLAEAPGAMRSGPFGSALLKSELTETGIPFLGIDNVHVERFVPKYRRFISEAKYQELSRYTVYPRDVMVTIMGTVGRCCVVPEGIGRAISSKHVWTLTLDVKRYSPALLAWQINHEPRVLEQLRASAQGGIMSAISSDTLRNLSVPLPPQEQMLELEQLLLSSNSAIAALEDESDKLRHLRTAASSDLLSGRVR